MQSLSVVLHLSLALTILGGVSGASAEPLCRVVLPDGRVILSRPVLEGNSLVCSPTFMSQGAAPTIPSMRFTTGTVGPFTTGAVGPFTTGTVGPFTTGEIGPVTTFSNTPATPGAHR